LWSGEAEPAGLVVPGAQQLEVVRRLNLVGSPSPALVERVLSASAPGRGSPDLELAGAGPEFTFGPRPVDPEALSSRELLRVVTGVIAADLAAAPPSNPVALRPRPWRRGYRLVGDPGIADPWRARLVTAGRPPGGRAPTIVVVGQAVDQMLAGVWLARCFTCGAVPWEQWLARWEQRRALPPRIDLVAQAHLWVDRTGPGRVHVVLDPAAREPQLVHPGTLTGWTPPPLLSADAAELGRRTATMLSVLVPAHERAQRLTHVLRPQLQVESGPPPNVPEPHRSWVTRRARRLAEGLAARAAGYAVHGNPESVVPVWSDAGAQPTETGALEVGLRLLLREERG
jgi:hypothetical protein